MEKYKNIFIEEMGIRSAPNNHDTVLFSRAKRYIAKTSWIPGIEMIAVVNSLSMYATHPDSDIDLFILTRKWYMWLVRFLITLEFFWLGVWRHGRDIRGNFCLSFFMEESELNIEKIAIDTDIYLYYWVYYMKPILSRNNTYNKFLEENTWVSLSSEEKAWNQIWKIDWEKQSITIVGNIVYKSLNWLIQYIWMPYTFIHFIRLWKPKWIIISKNMLKFHTKDRREEIRDTILKKNFDK